MKIFRNRHDGRSKALNLAKDQTSFQYLSMPLKNMISLDLDVLKNHKKASPPENTTPLLSKGRMKHNLLHYKTTIHVTGLTNPKGLEQGGPKSNKQTDNSKVNGLNLQTSSYQECTTKKEKCR